MRERPPTVSARHVASPTESEATRTRRPTAEKPERWKSSKRPNIPGRAPVGVTASVALERTTPPDGERQ